MAHALLSPRRLPARPSLILAALSALLLLAVSVPAPASAATPPLPACRYEDVDTRYAQPAEWRWTLVDTILRVPRTYLPTGLVSTSEAGLRSDFKVKRVMIADLRALAGAARRAGVPIRVNSGYRSYAQQRTVFNGWVKRMGYARALQYAARPGHSEHQLGVGIDFGNAGTWLANNAWRYGFVLSYPKGKRAETCYAYEPWHFRYVGRALAEEIRDSGLTLRRFLWERFEHGPHPQGSVPRFAPLRLAL